MRAAGAITLAAAAGAQSPAGWSTCGGLNATYSNTACPDSATCCTQKWEPAKGNWGCCPFKGATCCANGYTCCPSGTTCVDKGSGWGVVTTCVAEGAESAAEPALTVVGAGNSTGDQVCKTGPPNPYSATQKNVLIIGDSVSIGYTPYVAKLLADVAVVQHSPWGGDGGAEETKYGAQCIDYLIRAPGGTELLPDVLMFNWGLHNSIYPCTSPCDPGQKGPPEEYAPFLKQIVARLQQIGAKTKLLFAITSPMLCNAKLDAINVDLNNQAVAMMKDAGIPTVDLYSAITGKCGDVPQSTCFNASNCFCPHCAGTGYSWLADNTIAPAIRALL